MTSLWQQIPERGPKCFNSDQRPPNMCSSFQFDFLKCVLGFLIHYRAPFVDKLKLLRVFTCKKPPTSIRKRRTEVETNLLIWHPSSILKKAFSSLWFVYESSPFFPCRGETPDTKEMVHSHLHCIRPKWMPGWADYHGNKRIQRHLKPCRLTTPQFDRICIPPPKKINKTQPKQNQR